MTQMKRTYIKSAENSSKKGRFIVAMLLVFAVFFWVPADFASAKADTKGFQKYIEAKGKAMYKGKINVSKYNVKVRHWIGYEHEDSYMFSYKYPGLFFVSPYDTRIWISEYSDGYPYDLLQLSRSTAKIEAIQFKYLWSNATTKKRKKQVEAKINKIVKKAKKKKGQKAKIKYVNNALKKIIRGSRKWKKNSNNRNIYGALVQRYAICEGYAKTFYECMKRLKIPCGYEMNHKHVWNKVYLTQYKKLKNGKKKKLKKKKKYIVDVTWNDDGSGKNKYLLIKKHPLSYTYAYMF